MTPDKLGGNVLNPQSLNRYAYVTNNPASFNDPSGLIRNDPWGCFIDSTGFGYYCPNASDEQPSDFGVGFVNPILPRFLPGGNGHGAFLIHMTMTSTAPAAGQPALANNSPCQGGKEGISPGQGQQVLSSSQKFFGIPYNQQVCNVFVCNSINASNIVPGQKIYATTKTISSSPYFAPVPASQAQAADVMVFSNPSPYHMGFYVPNPPSPNKIIDTFLSSTVHGNGGLGGPRYLPPQPPYFNGMATYYRLQEPCHE